MLFRCFNQLIIIRLTLLFLGLLFVFAERNPILLLTLFLLFLVCGLLTSNNKSSFIGKTQLRFYPLKFTFNFMIDVLLNNLSLSLFLRIDLKVKVFIGVNIIIDNFSINLFLDIDFLFGLLVKLDFIFWFSISRGFSSP